MAHLSIRLLGTYAVQLAEQPVTNFRSVKNQALLAYLMTEADRPHTRAALAGLLWPDDPEPQALRNLRQALFRLRHVLDNDSAQPPFLEINTTTVQFNDASDHWFDGAAFVQLLAACTQHSSERGAANPSEHRRHCGQCCERLAQAVALYRGEFMHGIYIDGSPALEEWLLLRREWFHHQTLTALYDLAAWHEMQQHYSRVYDYAKRQVELDPLREEAHRQLMRALALDGKRSEALAQYEACYTVLYEELGTAPTAETEQLVRQIEEGTLRAPLTSAHPQPLANDVVAPPSVALPAPATPFFGREEERAQLRTRLLDPAQRLITLLGQGGVGKTRLALAAAADLTGAFADGVWFVALERVTEKEGLVTALAGALGFHFQPGGEPKQQLFAYLRQREMLLILDNVEQLVGPAPLSGELLIAQLLEQAPRLKMLVTSRVRLNLQWEQVLALGGLPVPSIGGQEISSIPVDTLLTHARRYSSVALFVERAQRSGLGFVLTGENVTDVMAICQLVEGLPLGIELAAAWTEHFRCAEIAAAIHETLDFLQSSLVDLPPRQRSLHAVFDYSWQLLTPAEQQALAQMSIFRAAFSREAAQRVAQVALPQLLALVNKSLVRTVAAGRYAMHELVRQFAAEWGAVQLATEARAAIAQRHADYYLHLVQAQEGLWGEQPQNTVAQLLQEIEHLRQAWQWAVDQKDAALLLAALPNLARAFDLAGLYREAATTW
ncbi:MAG: winged helix-turn-helix domain-containing protein, partial [Caldilineaceae bacterium]|nr:winged helix-turn-helix domain-containing protein [Caldilineaceae bacterium]